MLDKIKEKLGIKKEVTLDDLIRYQLDTAWEHKDDYNEARYDYAVKQVKDLVDIKVKLKGLNKMAEIKIDPNTVIVVLGAIGEVLLIINHEQTGAIVSKAFSRVIRPRL